MTKASRGIPCDPYLLFKMNFMSRVFSNTTSLMTSVFMLYVGAMAASSYLSKYADKLLKGDTQSTFVRTEAVITHRVLFFSYARTLKRADSR